MGLNARKCPGCKKPLNGQTCKHCGTDPSNERIVSCRHCNDRVVESKTNEYQDNRLGRTGTYHVCWECQD